MLPKLLHERLDDMGIDVSILYPTFGLLAPHLDDQEIRLAACRAFNTYHADIFKRLCGSPHPGGAYSHAHPGRGRWPSWTMRSARWA